MPGFEVTGDVLRGAEELLGAQGDRGVDHLAIDIAGAVAFGLGALKGADDTFGEGDLVLGGGEGAVDGLDLIGVDSELAFEAQMEGALRLPGEANFVADVWEGGIDGELMGRLGADCDAVAGEEELNAVLGAGDAHIRGEVLGAEGQGDDARGGGGDLEGADDAEGAFDEGDDADLTVGEAFAPFERRQHFIEATDVVGGVGLGKKDAGEVRGNDGVEVVEDMRRIDGVDADEDLTPLAGKAREVLANEVASAIFFGVRDATFEIGDEGIGIDSGGLGEEAFTVARHEEEGA